MKRNNNIILPKIIGHRGVKNLAPENTLDSISKAFDIGLHWVEVDVKITKDNVPFLLHDDSLERTTNGHGLANLKKYSEIKLLDAGYYFYNKKTKIYPPSLQEVLELIRQKKKSLNIELKPNKGFEQLNVIKTIEVIEKFSDLEIYYSSFDIDSCILLKEILPKSHCGLLIDDFEIIKLQDIIELCNKFDFFLCGLNYKIVSKDIIDVFNYNKISLNVFSDENININQAKNLWHMGIKSIFSDDPRNLIIV